MAESIPTKVKHFRNVLPHETSSWLPETPSNLPIGVGESISKWGATMEADMTFLLNMPASVSLFGSGSHISGYSGV